MRSMRRHSCHKMSARRMVILDQITSLCPEPAKGHRCELPPLVGSELLGRGRAPVANHDDDGKVVKLSELASAGIRRPPGREDRPREDFGPKPPAGCSRPLYVLPAERGRVVSKDTIGAVRISCGKCFGCALTRKSMLVGRMAGEAAMSVRTVLVTLTYRDVERQGCYPFGKHPKGNGVPPERASKLLLDDVRAFRKSLVKRYGGVQYVIAGEYGSRTRRAHWHALVFFRKEHKLAPWADFPTVVPAAEKFARMTGGGIGSDAGFTYNGIEILYISPPKDFARSAGIRCVIPEWPHGHVDIRTPDHGGFGYVAKYMLKDSHAAQLDVRANRHSQKTSITSRGLGVSYVIDLGERHAEQGLEPQSGLYIVDGSKFRRGVNKGKYCRFPMTRAMRREFLNAYLRRIACDLALGVRKLYRAGGEFLNEHLDRDAQLDPRVCAAQFVRGFLAGPRSRPWRASWVEAPASAGGFLGALHRSEKPVDECSFSSWRPDPLRCWGSVIKLPQDTAGFRVAFFSRSPGGELVHSMEVDRWQDLKALFQSGEWGDIALIGHWTGSEIFALEGAAAAGHARRGLRDLETRWSPPPEQLGNRGVRSVGLPAVWDSRDPPDDPADAYPLFWRWMVDAVASFELQRFRATLEQRAVQAQLRGEVA